MVNKEHDTKVESMSKLRNQFSDALSLLDFARIMELIMQISKLEGHDVLKTHMHVGENGQAIPNSRQEAIAAIRKLGGFDELDYVSASVPERVLLNADFRNSKIIVRTSESNLLNQIKDQWDRLRDEISDSIELAPISLSLDARRFILRCIDKDGTVNETSNNKLPVSKYYVISGLKELGLSRLHRLIASRLTKLQNNDGGWSDIGKGKSDLMATASAVLALVTLSEVDNPPELKSSLTNGLAFITNGRSLIEMQSRGLEDKLANLLTALSFASTGNNVIDSTLLKVVEKAIEDSINLLSPVLISLLLEYQVLNDDMIVKLRNQLVHKGFPIEKDESINSLATRLSLLALADNYADSVDELTGQSVIRHLVRTRNNDGGWPANHVNSSSFSTTLNVLVALNQFHDIAAIRSSPK
jgi:prenyltransferase beta subunit